MTEDLASMSHDGAVNNRSTPAVMRAALFPLLPIFVPLDWKMQNAYKYVVFSSLGDLPSSSPRLSCSERLSCGMLLSLPTPCKTLDSI